MRRRARAAKATVVPLTIIQPRCGGVIVYIIATPHADTSNLHRILMKQEEIIRSATAYENARTACGKHEQERDSDKLAIGIAGKVAAARQIVVRPGKIDALRLVARSSTEHT